MPRQLHLEGPALEPLLQQARAEHGEQVKVVSAQRVRSGGFAGFFSREHFELTIDVSTGSVTESAGRTSSTATTTSSSTTSSTSTSSSGGDVLADLLAAADGADRADGAAPGPGAALAAAGASSGDEAGLGARRPGRPLSTESNDFDDMLAALQAQLLGVDGIDGGLEVTVPDPQPTAAPGAGLAPWQPVVLHDDGEASPVGTAPLPALAPIKVVPSPPVTPVSPVPVAGTVLIGPRRGRPVETGSVSTRRTVTGSETVSAERTVDVTGATTETVDARRTRTDTTEVTGSLTTTADPMGTVDPVGTVLPGSAVDPVEATTATTAAGSAVATDADRAPAVLSAPELVALGRLVGADPRVAAVAAAEVATSGCTSLRLALPMLATALAEEVAEPDGTDLRADVGDGPVLSAGAGDLVLVVGSPGRVRRAAQDVADELGTTFVARWSDETGTRPRGGTPTVGEGRRLPLMRARARREGMPLVVEVADDTLGDTVTPRRAGTGRTDLVRAVAPDLVVLAVDADSSVRRQAAVTSRVADACGSRPLLLSLVGCARASAPLVHTGWPVVLLDGRPATVGTWTGVLLDALRWAESG
ncbi:hypothetical protein [Jannaschia sp. R86511]|uniref:hypothetical protein n=1 Tax=Jannaschia sp. R86511 TaxID=3093853 RepID=UPI0036D3020B